MDFQIFRHNFHDQKFSRHNLTGHNSIIFHVRYKHTYFQYRMMCQLYFLWGMSDFQKFRWSKILAFTGRGDFKNSDPKFLETGFRDNGSPKKLTHWANFFVVSWGHRPFGTTVAATLIFPPKIRLFPKKHQIIISQHQWIENSLLSYHKKFSQIEQKMAEIWPKRMPYLIFQ